MGKRGPAPKPTPLRVLHGDRKDRINTAEPVPDKAEVKPPAWLPKRAKTIWGRLAPDLISKGVLTHWDADLFATYCALVPVNQDAVKACYDRNGRPRPLVSGDRGLVKNPAIQVARDTTEKMIALAARFGLTPSDRGQLKIPGERDASEAERFFR